MLGDELMKILHTAVIGVRDGTGVFSNIRTKLLHICLVNVRPNCVFIHPFSDSIYILAIW